MALKDEKDMSNIICFCSLWLFFLAYTGKKTIDNFFFFLFLRRMLEKRLKKRHATDLLCDVNT
jgi:hypothetical protein